MEQENKGMSNKKISQIQKMRTGNDGEETDTLVFAERVFAVFKLKNGMFYWEEQCDGCFSETLSKEDSLILLDEIREFIDSQKGIQNE